VRCFWLKCYCLSCMRSVASSLSSCKAMFLLTERVGQSAFWNETPVFILPDLLPPNNTDWLYKYGRSVAAGLASSWRRWTETALDRYLCTWICVKGRHFEHFNLTLVGLMHVLFCVSCLLILWTLSKCYCVKCSRISPISFFYISLPCARLKNAR